ncbi:MAG: hypothetical protein RLZ58_1260 [Pseudomonadota bacterium]|jgi:Cu/Ag efflux protein CusF
MNTSLRHLVSRCAVPLITSLSLASAAALAQTPPERAEAEVRRIDKDAKKVMLKHGPIKSLDMPPMTMVFQVRDAALLDSLAVGDKILFTAEKQQGAYVVTTLEKAK